MLVTSPLGRYATAAALVVALAIIGAWIVALFIGNVAAADKLSPFAFAAFGAIFGSAATVNGVKRDQDAIQARLDAANIPSASTVKGPTA